MDLKKLYIGSSMGDLNKKAVYEFDSNRSVKIHINHSDKTFQAAEEARLTGDQERAYILYMRYSDIFQKVRRSKGFKKDASHYSLLLSTKKIGEAIQQAEELSNSLKKRYDAKKIIETNNTDNSKDLKERTPLSPKSTNLKDKNGFKKESAKVVPHQLNFSPLSKEVKTISSEKLYELLFNNPVPEYQVLMVDIRSSGDFNLSCIRHPNCINISKDILTPGIVCKKIDSKVEIIDHLEKWKNRATVDVIVLIDWYASEKRMNDVQDPLRCIRDALIKWEQEIFLKRDPVLLNGGYADWLDYYPQFTTNSKVERPQIKRKNVTSVTSLTDFSFRGLIPQVENGSHNGETTVDETDIEKENWESAEIIADVSGSKFSTSETADAPPSATNDFDGAVSTSQSSLYPTVPLDITLVSSKKESLPDVIKDASKPSAIPQSPAKKSIPTVDRTKKPTIPSRDLKPKQTPVTSDVKNEPITPNLDGWPAFSEIASLEKPQPSSNFHAEYAETIGRVNANRKKMEEEDKKLKDLQEKKKLAEAQALERQMLQEAKEKEMERKLAEKELANTMRELSKAKKPTTGQRTTTEQEPEVINKTTMPVSNDAPDKSALDKSQLVVRRDNKPVVSEKKDVITEMLDVPQKDVKINEPKPKEPSFPTSNHVVDYTQDIVSPPETTAKTPAPGAGTQKVVVKRQAPPQTNVNEPSNHGATLQKNLRQKPTNEPLAKPSSTIPKKSMIKTDDTKENAKLKMKPVVKTSSPRELPQPKKSGSNIERKGTTNLPINWEKRLDPKTGRYFYLNHKNKTTHWQLPNDVRAQISRVPLKDDSAPSSGSLKRSSSTPNIAQLVENENADALGKSKPTVPNRGNKPSAALNSTPVPEAVADPPDEYARNLARLHPEMGGTGPGLCGLRNLGNTCYMNSVLQCMFSTAYLAKYFLGNSYKPFINKENFLGSRGEITEGFALLMKATWEGRYRSLTPKDFRYTISKFNSRFYTYTQQDSQELLLFLMDGLHEDLNEIKERVYVEEKDDDENISDRDAAITSWNNHNRLNKSVIVKLFQGQFKATVRCLDCNKTSRKFDVFMYLSLPIPSSGNCSINHCVKTFSEDEKLSGDNKWRCPNCKTERNAVRKMEIWKLPPVLLIHFKRFSFSGRWGDKVQTSVRFPENNLDLNNFVKGPDKKKTYQLYSVSHHYGATLDSGHYVASCKNPVDQKWYKYDDHEVSRTSAPQGPSAYILCYTSLKHSLELR